MSLRMQHCCDVKVMRAEDVGIKNMCAIKSISAAAHLGNVAASICSSQACDVNREMTHTRRRLLYKASHVAAAAAALAVSVPLSAHAQSAVQRTQQEYDGYAGEQQHLIPCAMHIPCEVPCSSLCYTLPPASKAQPDAWCVLAVQKAMMHWTAA